MSTSAVRDAVRVAYRQRFGADPSLLVRAPGRVNLIGEHTDYSEGFVLPMAIDPGIWLALSQRSDRRVLVHSLDFQQDAEFDLDLVLTPGKTWADYLKGITWALAGLGLELHGWQGVLAGDIPIGAGLSSSAAVEMAAAFAFAALGGWEWEPRRMAQAGRTAESEWVGVRGGLMDQMVCAGARAGHAFFLDCRTLDVQHIPMPDDMRVALLDTGTRRDLANSAYNQRSAQIWESARLLGVTALRDADEALLDRRRADLGDVLFRRARHVIRENQRVLQFKQSLQTGDLPSAGALLNASHSSLQSDFEVSSPALDAIVQAARRAPGCLGARLTGAGFAGCALALLRRDAGNAFADHVRRAIPQSQVWLTSSQAGVHLV